MSGVESITLGCRLNSYESDRMQTHARAAGLDNTVIINSCAVTNQAERETRKVIRAARRQKPDASIIVTGCSSHVNAGTYAAMTEIDYIISNDVKLNPAVFASLGQDKIITLPAAEKTVKPAIKTMPEGRTRAHLQVQNGCDHRCTFCIIPYGRGDSRSVPVTDIITTIRQLVDDGVKEVVLTGVDVTSYGHDLPDQPRFGTMVAAVLKHVPALPRLRLSSLDPAEIDDDLWHVLATEPRLMPYWHLSIQAGDDLILKRMKRRHLRDDVIKTVERARALRPDITFGADFITGFPTETEAMFDNTLDLAVACNLTWLHVFPYSERAGTPAARMPAVDHAVRKERAARLRAVGQERMQHYFQQQLGTTQMLLVEKGSKGHLPSYGMVHIAPDHHQHDYQGQLRPVRITGFAADHMSGELA